jgi:hypothetical protein
MCAHSRAERGIVSRRVRMMANSTTEPKASRAKVTSTGEKPRSASLIHKNADPQISASKAMRGSAERLTATRPARRARVTVQPMITFKSP